MADLNVFTYQDRRVRTILIGGEPWFVLADLTKVLGLARGAAQVSERLDDGVRQTYIILDSLGRPQKTIIVSEAGMYEVVIRSDKPEAVAFRRWITGEVLPEIRKTGSYGAQPAELTREEILRLALAAEEEKKALEAKVAEDAPKVDYHERFVSPPEDAVTIEFFAAQFGVTEPHVRDLMIDRRVAVRRTIGKRWSKSKGRMEPVYEWRPAAGPAQEWFEVRPQHNAPRHHNGQVRTTMYVRQFYADQLAQKLGLAAPTLTEETP